MAEEITPTPDTPVESNKQPVSNSDPGHYPVWKYLWRIVSGGLLLLSLELSAFIIADFFLRFQFQYFDKMIIFLFWWLVGFLVVNLLVARFVILLPSWQEPRSLKTATLALGGCLLNPLLFVVALLLKITTNPPYTNLNSVYRPPSFEFNWGVSVSILQFMLLVLSLTLSAIGLEWGRADDRKGDLLNQRAGVAARLSRVALGICILFMIPTCCLLMITSGFPGF